MRREVINRRLTVGGRQERKMGDRNNRNVISIYENALIRLTIVYN